MTRDSDNNGSSSAGVMSALSSFLRLESAGGIVLVAMMALALAAVNSPLADWYDRLLAARVVVGAGGLVLDHSLLAWINDGLMAVFFLLVALEIKREALEGELSSGPQIALPALAAVGGMAVPAGLYVLFAGGDEAALRGWAIPSATDIAFSLGVLSLLGRRVPLSLRVFLTALAIIDDLGAIVIIALFYSHEMVWPALAGAGAVLAVLVLLNRMRVARLWPYLLAGLLLWGLLLESGLHATIAGVLAGLAIPLRLPGAPLRRLEHALHPWVAFGILPLFAFANSGLPFDGMGLQTLADPVFLGVAAGLFLGKQAGVFAAVWLAVRLGLGTLPAGASWTQMYGVCILTGIGFTMSLFIGGLAFPDGNAMVETRLGVIVGSLASALLGWVVLVWAKGKERTQSR